MYASFICVHLYHTIPLRGHKTIRTYPQCLYGEWRQIEDDGFLHVSLDKKLVKFLMSKHDQMPVVLQQ